MSHPREADPLRPMLESAQTQLAERLEEACAHDVTAESTAELVRLEESLSEAARAAKQAVSLRRRLSTGHGAADQADASGATAGTGLTAAAAGSAEGATTRDDEIEPTQDDSDSAVRDFLDEKGRAWRVWAVEQEQLHSERLLADKMGEYRQGWLAFECTDDGERRRLPHFPPNWRRLTNLDLEGLLGRAETARRRRATGENPDTTTS